MQIDDKVLNKLTNLSRLKLNKSESEDMFSDLKQIVSFVNKLNEIDTRNIAPLTHVHDSHNVYRSDSLNKDNPKGVVFGEVTNNNSDYFRVPKMLKNK